MIRIEDWSGLGGSTQRLHHKHSVITRYIHSVATVTLKDELAVFMMGPAELQAMVPPPDLEEYHAEVTVSAGHLRNLALLYTEWIDKEDAISALEEGIAGLNLANASMDRANLLWDAFLDEDA